MAAYAIIEISDTFFPVFALNICPVVIVTAVTRVVPECAWVAGAAAAASPSVVNRKPVSLVEGSWNPGRSIVAAVAILAE